MNATIKDQITTVEWNRREKTVTIVGLFGTKVVREDNPVEIGLAVIEVMTGEELAPPTAYRTERTQSGLTEFKCEEEPE